jgi:hypothetical protein
MKLLTLRKTRQGGYRDLRVYRTDPAYRRWFGFYRHPADPQWWYFGLGWVCITTFPGD